MVSLPCLLLIPHRFTEAKSTLKYFAKYCRKGLIPNTFPAFGGEPVYNTVGASLWFIHALEFDGDYPYTPGGCIAQAWSVAEIFRAYVEDVLGIKP